MSEWCNMLPQEWHKYVNQEVVVTSRDKQQHEGWVFTVDPVSASVVLVTFPEEGGASVTVVLGHTVNEVQILRGGDDELARRLSSLFMPAECQTFSSQKLQERKENLRMWLEKNLIPVTEEGDALRVANVLTIIAPYGAEQCTSTNEIILARVQSLVESNPGPESQE